MKIACIYFPISSVGGIATVAKTFKRAAQEAKDTFHILRSSNAKTIQPGLFPAPSRIRGGDTHIEIDGEAPHGEQMKATRAWLEKNYDALFFVHPCCHPTKAYGDDPRWMEMYDVALPKAMRFSDGYAETYPWVKEVVEKCTTVFVNQEAYAIPLVKMGITDTVLLPQPFLPFPAVAQIPRSKTRLTIFPNQWKQIKCPWEFVEALPQIKGAVEMFSNGIEYYNIRGEKVWKDNVGVDYFAPELPLKGPKNHRFHGNIPLERIAEWYGRAWSMVDLMGQRAKHGAYREGAFNCTAVEALWYGCRPILHDQAKLSKLPQDVIWTTNLGPKHKDLSGMVRMINTATPLNAAELKRARDWVLNRHGAAKLWKRLKAGVK